MINKKAAFPLAVLIAVCFIPLASSQTGANVTVHFIDVGQGDSIFIDTSNRDVLIDGGSATASQTVIDYLDYLNITHIHLVIATHMHEDHIGGLVPILNSTITIDEILVNNQTHTSNTYNKFITLAQTHNLTIAQRGQTFTLTETANLTVYNPVQPLEFSDLNDNSIVVKLQVCSKSFLFTGDAEEDAEQSMISAAVNLQSDVLKVGHHGSNTATSQAFLDLVSPSYAIISAGENNSYGHPHEETMQKLLAKGVTIYGTITSETIITSTDGTTITFQDDPQPIPEFPSNLTLTILVIVTLLAVMIYRKKLQKLHTFLGS
jgi:competence protein ComEC